ncbi:MAG: glycerol-3-phosphate 1-O-acyltransferase PlsY [Bacteroidetes bacterium]|nr:glycerol-3-phosphate 1-O-acyltransferase PlsY [Bacteroidota bacterium]
MSPFLIALLIIIAYLIGSVPSAVWIGKIFYHTDVRQHGSGNAGATNVIRVLGYKAGIPVLLFDVFKGWAAVQVVFLFPHAGLTEDYITYIRIGMAFAAVLGHVFPIFAGFKGGKGVGTLAGAAIALYPIALLVVLGLFILTIAITRYVSLSSVLCGICFPFIVIFATRQYHPGLVILAIVVAIFIPLTHIKNIRRLLKGEENKFDFRRKKKETEIGNR